MTRTIKNSATLVAVMLTVYTGMPGAATAAEISPELRSVIGAANKEGVLTLSWGRATLGGEKGAARAEKEINQMFGTKIRITFTPGRSMPAIGFRMLAEKKAGRNALSDVYIGALVQIGMFSKRRLFQTTNFTALLPSRIDKKLVEAGDTAVRAVTSVSGVTFNTKLAPMKPRYLADFLKPEWKGKIASTPYLANFDFLAAKNVLGPDKAVEFVRNLSGQVSGLIRCPDTQRLLSGEFVALIFDCGGREAFDAKKKGAPLDQMVPLDFGKITYYYLAVPAHSGHPNAAKLYVAYLMTREGQRLIWDLWQADLHTFPESNMRKRIANYEKQGVRFSEYDVAWWTNNPEVSKAKKQMRKILIKKRKR